MSREEGGLGAGSGRALTFQQGSGRCLGDLRSSRRRGERTTKSVGNHGGPKGLLS